MTRLYLLLIFVGRSAFLGLVLGAILGLISGLIFGLLSGSLFVFGLLIGLFAGAVSGILLGGLNGVVFTIVTLLVYHPDSGLRSYRLALLLSGIVVMLLGSWFWFSNVLQLYSETGTVSQFLLILLILISTVAAGYASQHIASDILDDTRQTLE